MDIFNKIKAKIGDSYTTSRSVETEPDPEEVLQTYCLLFPTYATKNLEGKSTDQWNIRVRGWAFSAPKKSKMRNLFLGLTSLATGIKKTDERFQYLESRTSYFWTNNVNQGEFTLQVEGLTDANRMTIEGDPNDESPFSTTTAPDGDGVVTTTANVPDVKKVLGHAGKMIKTQSHPASETTHVVMTPKSGHVTGNLSIPEKTVIKWISEENNKNVVGGLLDNIIGSKDKDRIRLLKIKAYQDEVENYYGVVNLVEPKGISIISDIDDTIKDTNILDGAKRVISNTFLSPFRDVPGMADLYRKFYEKGAAIHYVSNSPWQLFPSLQSFFHTYNFPPGSAHFKFYDGLLKSAYEQKENPMASKFMYIRELLKDFPDRQFILIGDTGELDPEIYTTIVRENPGRILRIYVRDVTTKHVENLPPQKPKHSYTRTFPTIYNYLRNYYDEEYKDKPEEEQPGVIAADTIITRQAVAATSGETEDPKLERKSSLSTRLLDKLHIDMSYLHGTSTTIYEAPETIDHNGDTKPKTPLSAKILSPERAASLSSKLSKLRSSSQTKSRGNDKPEDDDYGSDDDNEELKTPLEMFQERCKLLHQGMPDGMLHLFTDASEIENDPVIKKAFDY